jgi:SAM-dependent methyltransferase
MSDEMKPEDLNKWFENIRHVLETAYLSHAEPWKQSGMSGPEERWISLRKPVADCVDKPGSFLDIGCANGYLLECCIKWTAERGITIDPYGLDISPRLVQLARSRLPQVADHFFVGNAFDWILPIKFDYVRTELVYVPAEHEGSYIERVLKYSLKPEGRLLVANYTEDHPNPEKGIAPGNHPTQRILERLGALGYDALGYKDGYDPVKDRRVRIAILTHGSASGH